MPLLIQKVNSAVHKLIKLHVCPCLYVFLFVELIIIRTWELKIQRVYKGILCKASAPRPQAQSLSLLNTCVSFHPHGCPIPMQTVYIHIALFP